MKHLLATSRCRDVSFSTTIFSDFNRYRLICSPDQRLGRNGAEEIKAHPYFAGFDWNGVRESVAAHVPQLQSITDTSYFPTEDLDQVPDMPSMQGMSISQPTPADLTHTLSTYNDVAYLFAFRHSTTSIGRSSRSSICRLHIQEIRIPH